LYSLYAWLIVNCYYRPYYQWPKDYSAITDNLE